MFDWCEGYGQGPQFAITVNRSLTLTCPSSVTSPRQEVLPYSNTNDSSSHPELVFLMTP